MNKKNKAHSTRVLFQNLEHKSRFEARKSHGNEFVSH